VAADGTVDLGIVDNVSLYNINRIVLLIKITNMDLISQRLVYVIRNYCGCGDQDFGKFKINDSQIDAF
jgi:hypothetical protein